MALPIILQETQATTTGAEVEEGDSVAGADISRITLEGVVVDLKVLLEVSKLYFYTTER